MNRFSHTETGPGQDLAAELDEERFRREELESILIDVEQVLNSMESSGDMPEQEAHRQRLKDLHEQIQTSV